MSKHKKKGVEVADTKETERAEVLMDNEGKELLKRMYLIRSYSGYEEPLRNFITEWLTAHSIPYINYNGNILGLNHAGAPLFSAHMDMVNTEYYRLSPGESTVTEGVFTIDNKACIRLYRDKEKEKQTSLGADDKNGIWVALKLLSDGYPINFAFCHSEECGGTGSEQVVSNPDLGEYISKHCAYGVIIDRRNKGDIIGYSNKYCMALDDKLSTFAISKGFEFTPARGSVSDADRFSKLIECVNLSCGYYEPHTSREYTNLNELWDTYLLCRSLLDDFKYETVSSSRMQDFKSCSRPYKTLAELEAEAKKKKEKEEEKKEDRFATTHYSNSSYYGSTYGDHYYSRYWRDDDDDVKKNVTIQTL